ncbi:hypothetical protein IWX62_001738 [Arthrobacter sp. CAN_A1]
MARPTPSYTTSPPDAVGQFTDCGIEAFIAQHLVGAGLPGQRFLVVGGHRRDDPRPLGLEQLDEQQSHPTGTRVRQNCLPHLHWERGVDQVVRGHALQRERSRCLKTDPIRHRQGPIGVHQRELGIGADSFRESHPVADGETRRLGAQRHHFPGGLGAWGEGVLHRVIAAALVGLDVVDARRGYPHHKLGASRCGLIHLSDLQYVGSAGLLDNNGCGHQESPSSGCCFVGAL